jgi:hypothetical protein
MSKSNVEQCPTAKITVERCPTAKLPPVQTHRHRWVVLSTDTHGRTRHSTAPQPQVRGLTGNGFPSFSYFSLKTTSTRTPTPDRDRR